MDELHCVFLQFYRLCAGHKLSESRVEDEHSNAKAALEVRSQDALCMIMFGLEQTEIKFRDELKRNGWQRRQHVPGLGTNFGLQRFRVASNRAKFE